MKTIRFWCEKKGRWIHRKKAVKKCINLNIKKRGMRCPSLMTEEDAILFSVKIRR